MVTTSSVYTRLEETFSPLHLEVTDESYKHQGHAGFKEGQVTHVYVFIVATLFRGLSHLQRHRLIYQVLEKDMEGSIHALSLRALTPEEYATLKVGANNAKT